MRISRAVSIRVLRPVLWAALLFSGVPAFAQERVGGPNRVVPVTASLCADMKTRHVLNAGSPLACDRLRLVRFVHLGFDGTTHDDGEIIVMDAAADHVLQIFETLYRRRFPLQRARLMNEYQGDDDASMDDNNTSSFNVRPVAGGSSVSLHAYGLAIDLNPVQNPFLQRTGTQTGISPKAGERFADRKDVRPGMSEPVVDVFAEHGFVVWGGEWKNPTDYQHFQVSRGFAQALARAPAAEARQMFERHVERYRGCMRSPGATRRSCVK